MNAFVYHARNVKYKFASQFFNLAIMDFEVGYLIFIETQTDFPMAATPGQFNQIEIIKINWFLQHAIKINILIIGTIKVN